jgi:signal transduction histidine kinase
MGNAPDRSEAVEELVARLAGAPVRGELRKAIASALADSTLRVAYWLERQERWVDRRGRLVEVPAPGDPKRAGTPVEHDGELVAMIVHDARLTGTPSLARVAAAAGPALENERLEAELRSGLAEVNQSRARIMEAEEHARRRLERNLHDGAQQRLVSLALELKLARSKLDKDPAAAAEVIERAEHELKVTIEEVREIARGIHPAVLTDRGLEPALNGLVHRSPLHVALECHLDERLPGPVESAVYFVVSEALTNVGKYAEASEVSVKVVLRDRKVLVQVKDDGIGGADPKRGTGLIGLADRAAALGGWVDMDSYPGEGTVVYAEIPCE